MTTRRWQESYADTADFRRMVKIDSTGQFGLVITDADEYEVWALHPDAVEPSLVTHNIADVISWVQAALA